MTLYAPRSAPRSTAVRAPATLMPEWAVERLTGLGDGPNATFLATAVRNAFDGVGNEHSSGVFHKHVRTVWDDTIMLPLLRSRNEHHLELRAGIGAYTSATRATDILARCMPLTARFEEGTPARDHLDTAITYLEAAAAVEAILDPPFKGEKQIRHAATREWTQEMNRHLGDALDGLKGAFAAAGSQVRYPAPIARPAAVAAGSVSPMRRVSVPLPGGDAPAVPVFPVPSADAAPLPLLASAWENHVKPAVTEMLMGGHGLWHSATDVTVEDGKARIDVVLSREATQVRVSLRYGAEGSAPAVSYAMGEPGNFMEREVGEVHRTLHEGRNDPEAIRLVSEIQRSMPGAGRTYSLTASGSRSVRLSPLSGMVDGDAFLDTLSKVEDLAGERDVKVEVGVDGLAVRVSLLVARGYEWAGRKGETVMARKGAPAHAMSFGR